MIQPSSYPFTYYYSCFVVDEFNMRINEKNLYPTSFIAEIDSRFVPRPGKNRTISKVEMCLIPFTLEVNWTFPAGDSKR